jgi:hypothetical protein
MAQSWKAKAGMNFSVFNTSDDYRSYNHYRIVKPGWNLGGFYEFNQGKLFSLETGLILETKGEKKDNSLNAPGDFTKVIDLVSLLYLDVPLMGKLNIPLKKSTLMLGAGPYAGIAIAGWSESFTTPKTNLNSRTTLDFGNKSFSSFRRFDYGGKAMVALEYRDLNFSLFYSGGLRSVHRLNQYHYKMINQTVGFSIGYKLKY